MSIIPAGTLGFYLRGTAFPNGSTVHGTTIGEGGNALQCTTDSISCCSNAMGEMRAGDFYWHDGSKVPIMNRLESDYYRTRGSGHILLNHRSQAGTATIITTGQFRCSIPDASETLVNLYINIGRYIIKFARVTIYANDDD